MECPFKFIIEKEQILEHNLEDFCSLPYKK